jgi:hypothetical protein
MIAFIAAPLYADAILQCGQSGIEHPAVKRRQINVNSCRDYSGTTQCTNNWHYGFYSGFFNPLSPNPNPFHMMKEVNGTGPWIQRFGGDSMSLNGYARQ